MSSPSSTAKKTPAKPRGIYVRFELDDWQKKLICKEASTRRGYRMNLRAALREYGLSLLT